MTVPFSTGKTISINQLTGVDITDVTNNDVLQYNSTNAVWDNGTIDLSPVLFAIYKDTDSTTSDFPISGWDVPTINIGGGTWDNVGTYTVVLAGYYDLNFQAQIQTTSPNSQANFIALYVNGVRVSFANQLMVNVAAGDEYLNMVVSRLIYLNIGDEVITGCSVKNSGVLNNSHLKIIRVSP